jgi:hypothetical protein
VPFCVSLHEPRQNMLIVVVRFPVGGNQDGVNFRSIEVECRRSDFAGIVGPGASLGAFVTLGQRRFSVTVPSSGFGLEVPSNFKELSCTTSREPQAMHSIIQ